MLVVDVEGYERNLLDPAVTPALKRAMMIVEVHDRAPSRAIADALVDRFSETHVMERIVSRDRSVADYVEMRDWLPIEAALAVSEGRPTPSLWMILTPE
ncbi:MAG: hypothetical protein ACR2ND_06395 [Solirubrobacteraceae bacterium]